VDLFRRVPFEQGRPSLVIAHTVKGKGIHFMENAVEWHHHVPSDEEFAAALVELDRLEAQMEGD
jgi:transketolase